MFEFDLFDTYRLVDVLDHNRNSKANTHDFYRERVGCIATNIHKGLPCKNGGYYIFMDFIQDAEGNWIDDLHLRTSLVSDVIEADGCIEIHTANSIYILMPFALPEPEYQTATDLIELYLFDGIYHFARGYLHDENGKVHELMLSPHVGMFQDSCLIMQKDGGIICRYFPRWSSAEFYGPETDPRNFSKNMLIHHVGKYPLEVRFGRYTPAWDIAPGESLLITPADLMKDREEEG